ncbi:sulfur carrier protein ThiS [Luteolibacter algae]|uniref:Sulfur carrier protein ThiS n=1 Tax=Luteolibacter algae TaxID=454151 RepID=A0ABW5D5R1_9BACT
MDITLNGQSHPLAGTTTLEELLESLDLRGKPVVVELNQTAILPRNFSSTEINPGDAIEIVTLAAGG